MTSPDFGFWILDFGFWISDEVEGSRLEAPLPDQSKIQNPKSKIARLRQQAAQVHGRRFVLGLTFIFSFNRQARDPVEVVAGILPGAVDQQVFFLVDQVLAVIFTHLKVRRQLDCVGRAGLLAVATENAAREVDPEELRIAPAMFVLCRLQRDAGDRTGNRAEVAAYTALAPIR